MQYPERPIAAFNPCLKGYDSSRGQKIYGVQLHATRSGKSDGDDGPRTEGWWANPSNDQGGWGSYADYLIYEDGTRIKCTDINNEFPKYTAGFGYAGSWNASLHYIQIEIAQGNTSDAFTDVQIASLAELIREDLVPRYGFPLVRIPHLNQSIPPEPGICTHEDSDNGRIYGKSDPGPMFPWDRFMALLGQEDDMALDPETQRYFDERWTGVFETLGRLEKASGRLEKAVYFIGAAILAGAAATGNIPAPW